MFGLGSYMYYADLCKLNDEVPQQSWIPVACIFLFTIACTVGFLVVPWVMIGELYPIQVGIKKILWVSAELWTQFNIVNLIFRFGGYLEV